VPCCGTGGSTDIHFVKQAFQLVQGNRFDKVIDIHSVQIHHLCLHRRVAGYDGDAGCVVRYMVEQVKAAAVWQHQIKKHPVIGIGMQQFAC
jgi:hypothetical protein